jgi:hypothetical protein
MRAAWKPKPTPFEAKRLAHGQWIGGKLVGEGDVLASYSADRIAEGRSTVAPPFSWRGALWICTGIGPDTLADVYRLVPRAAFAGAVTDYSHKTSPDAGERARPEALGFYHGVSVKYKGAAWVLAGPQLCLIAETGLGQMDLFGNVA